MQNQDQDITVTIPAAQRHDVVVGIRRQAESLAYVEAKHRLLERHSNPSGAVAEVAPEWEEVLAWADADLAERQRQGMDLLRLVEAVMGNPAPTDAQLGALWAECVSNQVVDIEHAERADEARLLLLLAEHNEVPA